MEFILRTLKSLMPRRLLAAIRPPYHFLLSWIGSIVYRNPSRQLTVIGITGTKGKSTTTEILAHLLRQQGHTVATVSTIRFTYGDTEEKNLYKMTLPGRFFLHKFLRKAVTAGCTHAVVELTSEGAKQFRHRFLSLDTLIFTNLSPEHIESHGSFEKYKAAKLELARQVERSEKRPRTIVANLDDEHGEDFLNFTVEQKLGYSLEDVRFYNLHKDGVSLVFQEDGKDVTIRVPLVGLFNVYNTLAAITYAHATGMSYAFMEKALRTLPTIRGRVEHFTPPKEIRKKITAVVDYAHTPDSLEQFYEAFKNERKICILGNTGGGRDTWKRPEMGKIAEHHCDHIILTNEDPYDENPRDIVEQMAGAIMEKEKLEIIMDRREAIKHAFQEARNGDYVLISGKGTDPYIMGPRGTKEPWSDAEVVKEELAKIK